MFPQGGLVMSLIQRDFHHDFAKLSLSNPDDIPVIAQICHALSSEFRLNILRQLRLNPQTIPELAKNNYVAMTTMIFHINTLLEAGLLNIEYISGIRGPVRKCYGKLERMQVDLMAYPSQKPKTELTYTMGVGQFVDSDELSMDCSFSTPDQQYRCAWGGLYARERFDATAFWSRSGYVTYAFPNEFVRRQCTEISISLEICSETYYYDDNYKSDITFWINDVELCTYTCPGDFGSRRGILNPDWWPESASQYGELKIIKINEDGVFLNNRIVNPQVKLSDLKLDHSNRMLFKLGNKKDAQYAGGFNLFGKGFGDYDQDIVLNATVQNETEIV